MVIQRRLIGCSTWANFPRNNSIDLRHPNEALKNALSLSSARIPGCCASRRRPRISKTTKATPGYSSFAEISVSHNVSGINSIARYDHSNRSASPNKAKIPHYKIKRSFTVFIKLPTTEQNHHLTFHVEKQREK